MPSTTPDQLRFLKTRAGEPVHPYVWAGVGIAGALGGLTAATQFVADRLAYHPNLGPPLYPRGALPAAAGICVCAAALAMAVWSARAGATRRATPALVVLALLGVAAARGPFYPPSRAVQWAIAYHRALHDRPAAWAPFRDVFARAQLAGAAGFLVSAAAVATLVLAGATKSASNAHGTAELGTGDEFLVTADEERRRRRLRQQRRFEPGIMIGRHSNGRLLWYHGPSHILTMAPTRSGKGVGAVVPTLLRYPGSIVCMDIKGENFAVTHEQRLKDGGEVYVLDPFRVTGDHKYHAFANPLDTIDTHGRGSDRALDECKALAEMLVEESGKENKHFTDEGRSLLATMMLHVCHEYAERPAERTLIKVRELLTLPEKEFTALLKRMGKSKHPLVQRGVARLLQKEERERTGVISTAQIGIDFLDSVPMAGVLVPPGEEKAGVSGGKESVVSRGQAVVSGGEEAQREPRRRRADLTSIKGGSPMTVYLVIPPEALKTHAAWIRLMIACINNLITRTPARPKHRILMLLDEFAQLGYMRPVLEGISLAAGYGVLFWLIFQDLAQLKGLYRDKWETFFSNCDVKQCFGTNDYTTAELLSKMAGETTVFTESGSSGRGRSFGKSHGRSTNYGESVAEKGRRVLFADEVMRLPRGKELLFVKESPPIIAQQINYLVDPEFAGMFAPNPMYPGRGGRPQPPSRREVLHNTFGKIAAWGRRKYDAAPARTSPGEKATSARNSP